MKLMERAGLFLAAVLLVTREVSASLESAPCNSTLQCQKIYNKVYECETNICMRKDYSYSLRQILGFSGIVAISAITNSGGVGAGIVIVPAFTLLFDFVSSDAIHLSRVTIFIGALVSFCINWRRRDPSNPKKLVINYHIAGVIIPFHLAGAEFGVIIGRFLPAVTNVCILYLLLILAMVKTYQRGKDEIKRESEISTTNQEIQQGLDSSISAQTSKETELDSAGQPKAGTSNPVVPLETYPKTSENDIVIRDGEVVGFLELVSVYSFSLFICLASFLLTVLSALIRGGHTRESIVGFESCTQTTALVLILTQIIVCALGFFSYHHDRDYVEKNVSPIGFLESITMLHPGYSLFIAGYITGIASGTVGVGGGLLLMIYLLSIGEDVHMSSAVGLFSILFSSCTTTIQSVMVGGVHPRHAYTMMLMSLLGSLIANFAVKPLIQKLKKPSIILWILMIMLIIAFFVIPVDTVFAIINSPMSSLEFGKFC